MSAEQIRPPVGLKPRWCHEEQRLDEISAAITRYIEAGMAIPMEWIEEHNQLAAKGTHSMSGTNQGERLMYTPDPEAPEMSLENLNRLIETMDEWSGKFPYTPAQTAAWRLKWFGQTPADDQRRREDHAIARYDELRRGFDRPEREAFTDWPNGQGAYD